MTTMTNDAPPTRPMIQVAGPAELAAFASALPRLLFGGAYSLLYSESANRYVLCIFTRCSKCPHLHPRRLEDN